MADIAETIARVLAPNYERMDNDLQCHADAVTLAAEVERLSALFQQTHGVHHGWVAECQRLRERVRVLEEALRPFAGLPVRGDTTMLLIGADEVNDARAALEGAK